MSNITCQCDADVDEVCPIHGVSKRKIPHHEKIFTIYIEDAPDSISRQLQKGEYINGYYLNYRGFKKYVKIKGQG